MYTVQFSFVAPSFKRQRQNVCRLLFTSLKETQLPVQPLWEAPLKRSLMMLIDDQ